MECWRVGGKADRVKTSVSRGGKRKDVEAVEGKIAKIGKKGINGGTSTITSRSIRLRATLRRDM